MVDLSCRTSVLALAVSVSVAPCEPEILDRYRVRNVGRHMGGGQEEDGGQEGGQDEEGGQEEKE